MTNNAFDASQLMNLFVLHESLKNKLPTFLEHHEKREELHKLGKQIELALENFYGYFNAIQEDLNKIQVELTDLNQDAKRELVNLRRN